MANFEKIGGSQPELDKGDRALKPRRPRRSKRGGRKSSEHAEAEAPIHSDPEAVEDIEQNSTPESRKEKLEGLRSVVNQLESRTNNGFIMSNEALERISNGGKKLKEVRERLEKNAKRGPLVLERAFDDESESNESLEQQPEVVIEAVLTDEPTSPEPQVDVQPASEAAATPAPEASAQSSRSTTGEGPLGMGANPALERVSNGGKPSDRERAKFNEYLRKQNEQESIVKRRQKERTEKFARESGLEDLYNIKLQAEHEAYLEELKFQKGNFLERGLSMLSKKERNRRSEARKAADKATFEWSKALAENTKVSPELKAKLDERNKVKSEIYRLANLPANEKTALTQSKLEVLKGRLDANDNLKLSKDESAQARAYYEGLVIRKRDTIIGPNQSRLQAKIDALPAREKTVFGKVVKGLGWLASSPLKLSSLASRGVGAGLFKAFGNKKLEGADLEREKAKYRRAGQVLVGATVGTAIGIAAAPGAVGAAGGALGYGAFLGLRSVLGITAGTAAGNFAGWAHSKTFGKSTREDYRHQVRRDDVESVFALKKQQEAEKHGSRANRIKREQMIRVGTAAVVGGATSFGLGEAFNHLPSVQHAWQETFQHNPLEHTPLVMHAGTHGPSAAHAAASNEYNAITANGEKLQMAIGGPNAEHININDSDKLFGHFGKMLERDFTNVPHHNYPAIDKYMGMLKGHDGHVSLHMEDHMARQFGFENSKGMSEIMHKGDAIRFDTKGQMTIVWADHARPPHVLIDSKGNINTDVSDITKHLGKVHEAVQHAVPAHETATPTSTGSENLGAAPEPNYSSIDSITALQQQHAAITEQYQKLTAPGAANDPNYAQLREAYDKNVAAYNQSYASVYGHTQAGAESAATPHSETTAPIETAPTVAEHFDLTKFHGYEVADSRTGQTGLVFSGPNNDRFIAELQKFAQQHPNQPIQYDAPGAVPPRVETGIYDPQNGFSIMRDLNMENTKLDPAQFKKEIY